MFKQLSNATFNNSLFSSAKIGDMHETMTRLYEAAWLLQKTKGQSAVARLMNASPQKLKNWESRGMSTQGMLDAQRLIGCRATWLETGDGEMEDHTGKPFYKAAAFPGERLSLSAYTQNEYNGGELNVSEAPDVKGHVPLISWVQAGAWSESVDIYEPGYAERWLPFLKNGGKNVFALRVDGDSMTARFGKSYPEGCIIFVDPDQRMPNNGDRIVAKLEGSQKTTFKVFTSDAGRVWLRPLNDSHPPIYDAFTVIGKVIGKWEDE